MAKRKQKISPISIDFVYRGIIAVLVIAALILSWLAMSSYIRHAGIFVIHDVTAVESLGLLDVAELEKLKGQNILSVDLAKVQERIAVRYPQIADLRVMRRFPDEISVSGTRRMPFAALNIDGHTVLVSRDGYFLGVPGKDDGALVVIKGLLRQKTYSGTVASGPLVTLALKSIEQVLNDPILSAFHLRSLDVSDAGKIPFVFGRMEDSAKFDVIMDKDSCLAKLKTVSVMLARTEFTTSEIKYIDLRFESPVIGKRKTKK